jgi:hypothetical protein
MHARVTRVRGWSCSSVAVICGFVLAAVGAGCAGPSEGTDTAKLSIRLKTELGAPTDFAQVRTHVLGMDSGDSWTESFEALDAMDFANEGVVVAKLSGLPRGTFAVKLLLLDSRGLLVAVTEQVVTMSRSFEAPFFVARASCENAWCGESLSCVNGACLPKECVSQPSLSVCSTPKPPAGGGQPTSAACAAGETAACSLFGCEGMRSCTDAKVWGPCEVGAQSEICNGADDDCDGVDDNAVGGCGGEAQCTVGDTASCNIFSCGGTRTCVEGGVWGACNVSVQPEACDGNDNDCDGIVDNSTSENCQTQSICTNGETKPCSEFSCSGVQTCTGGAWGSCVVPRTPETCDGTDNDCNGKDDDIATTACEAQCGAGTIACVDGSPQCTAPKVPSAEVCNGLDDNCDNQIDNIANEGCSTACGSGAYVCSGNSKICTAPQPSTDVPNNADDDCNGEVDNGHWFDPIKVTWADLKSHNFGCDNAFSPWWQCQQVADAICQGRGYLGGFGPVDWDDGGATGAWIQCIGHGGGATRTAINVTHLGRTHAQSMGRQIENDVRTWCFQQGYAAAVGTVKWYGDGQSVDVICLPAATGAYYELHQQWMVDRGCSDVNTLFATPICSRAAHLTCQNAYGKHGVPFFMFGNVGLVCMNDR